MEKNTDRLADVLKKIDDLLIKMEVLKKETYELRKEIHRERETQLLAKKTEEAKAAEIKVQPVADKIPPVITPAEKPEPKPVEKTEIKPVEKIVIPPPKTTVTTTPVTSKPAPGKNIEKRIGEKVVSIIGIVITIIGVGIGAKFAIDRELISPALRIVLGYIIGFGLMGFSLLLKKKYENFSAVLISGSFAVMYFITYFAYSIYGLFPSVVAFALMVVVTFFAVVASIAYNRQIVAHIGLIGAYGVPFLLSDGSGSPYILFLYMVIINAGVMAISLFKQWKSLYYASFGITWLIFASWYLMHYEEVKIGLTTIFLTLFFLTFYITFLAYKLIRKNPFEGVDILMLLLNSFIFYGLGYSIFYHDVYGSALLGLFTVITALLHFVMSMAVYLSKHAEKSLYYWLVGLAILFITIAVPVQLDGNWITLVWAGEAALFFAIGRGMRISLYERFAYPMILLAFGCIVYDLTGYTDSFASSPRHAFFNINFFSSLWVMAMFGIINLVNAGARFNRELKKNALQQIGDHLWPALWLIVLYYGFRVEISAYWYDRFLSSPLPAADDGSFPLEERFLLLKSIWVLNYSLFFLAVVSFLNIFRLKKQVWGYINLGFNVICTIVFLVQGFLAFGDLRDLYSPGIPVSHLLIRYFSIALVIVLLLACHRYTREPFMKAKLGIPFDYFLHTVLLWTASNELIHWMETWGYDSSYKLSLSIVWGFYALVMVALGIAQRKKYLRITAICIFGITLLKLFLYDISHLNTLTKTIVFISLGILLLVTSFLYNKYRSVIAGEEKMPEETNKA